MNQKGFIPILIIFLIVLIAGVGIYFGQKNLVKKQPSSPQISVDEASSWKSYQGVGYSLKYPTKWKVEKYNNPNYPDIVFKSEDFRESTEGITSLEQGAELNVRREPTKETLIDDLVRKNNKAGVTPSRIEDTQVDGVKALEYEFSYESTSAIDTAFIKNGIYYAIRFRYSDANSKQKYLATYKNLVSTFKFTN